VVPGGRAVTPTHTHTHQVWNHNKILFSNNKEQVTNQNHNYTAGHCAIGTYFNRFKILDDPTCTCKKGEQSVDNLLTECDLLKSERERERE
jgi:hypothetical protein